jgi:hypothetical protein
VVVVGQVLQDTRVLQKEIASLVSLLGRTFTATDELVFKVWRPPPMRPPRVPCTHGRAHARTGPAHAGRQEGRVWQAVVQAVGRDPRGTQSSPLASHSLAASAARVRVLAADADADVVSRTVDLRQADDGGGGDGRAQECDARPRGQERPINC